MVMLWWWDGPGSIRTPATAWKSARLVVERDDPGVLDAVEWNDLVRVGVASEPGRLDAWWRGVAEAYSSSTNVFQVCSTYGEVAFDAVLATGPLSVCVLQRSRMGEVRDGVRRRVAFDPDLEVAVTDGAAWDVLRRVLPPLKVMRADPKTTAWRDIRPVKLDEQAHAEVAAYAREHPDVPLRQVLHRIWLPAEVKQVLSSEAMTVWVQTVTVGERVGVGMECFLASGEQLFRVGRGRPPSWQQVQPGDLGAAFRWAVTGGAGMIERFQKGVV